MGPFLCPPSLLYELHIYFPMNYLIHQQMIKMEIRSRQSSTISRGFTGKEKQI